MSLKKLSFTFALWGLMVMGASAYCLWANAFFSAGLLSVAGFLILFFAHFFNRRHYWGFMGFLILQLLLSGIFASYLINYFRYGTQEFTADKTPVTAWPMLFGGLFLVTVTFLILAGSYSAKARRELK